MVLFSAGVSLKVECAEFQLSRGYILRVCFFPIFSSKVLTVENVSYNSRAHLDLLLNVYRDDFLTLDAAGILLLILPACMGIRQHTHHLFFALMHAPPPLSPPAQPERPLKSCCWFHLGPEELHCLTSRNLFKYSFQLCFSVLCKSIECIGMHFSC